MYILLVSIEVKPEYLAQFKEATLENARNSRLEPGVVRFDVLQQTQEPNRFLLVEVYRTEMDPARHKETSHYNRWREVAEPMMAAPRVRTVYTNISPTDSDW